MCVAFNLLLREDLGTVVQDCCRRVISRYVRLFCTRSSGFYSELMRAWGERGAGAAVAACFVPWRDAVNKTLNDKKKMTWHRFIWLVKMIFSEEISRRSHVLWWSFRPWRIISLMYSKHAWIKQVRRSRQRCAQLTVCESRRPRTVLWMKQIILTRRSPLLWQSWLFYETCALLYRRKHAWNKRADFYPDLFVSIIARDSILPRNILKGRF